MNEQEGHKNKRELRLLGRAAPIRAAVVQPLSAARWLLILIVAAGVYFFHGFLVPVLAALIIGAALLMRVPRVRWVHVAPVRTSPRPCMEGRSSSRETHAIRLPS